MQQKSKRIDISRLDQVIPLFAADEAVELAFLFGSPARGEAGALSDVDIALLLSSAVRRDEYLG